MALPYIGEIRMFAGNFAPQGWLFCEGQLLPIAEHEILFHLIGTTYGGDGQTNFALPDLRGRIPLASGNEFAVGAHGGVKSVTLSQSEVPPHSHLVRVSTDTATLGAPHGAMAADASAAGAFVYSTAAPTVAMNSVSIGSVPGGQPHENRMPYLCVSFIISLFGIYPSAS